MLDSLNILKRSKCVLTDTVENEISKNFLYF